MTKLRKIERKIEELIEELEVAEKEEMSYVPQIENELEVLDTIQELQLKGEINHLVITDKPYKIGGFSVKENFIVFSSRGNLFITSGWNTNSHLMVYGRADSSRTWEGSWIYLPEFMEELEYYFG